MILVLRMVPHFRTYPDFLVVLFSSENKAWKIADFGLTSEGTSNRLITTRYSRGRPCYRAPELLSDAQGRYSNKSDIWSLGCIVYELLIGEKAFAGDYAVFKYASIPTSLMPHDGSGSSHSFFEAFIEKLLAVNPTDRPSAEQAKDLNQLICFTVTSTPPDLRGSMPATLLEAARRGRLDIVTIMLKDAERSPVWIEVFNQSLKLAVIYQHKDIVKELVSAGANGCDALCIASVEGDLEAIHMLLTAGVDVHSKDQQGYTALLYATHNGQIEAARILIEAAGNLQNPDEIPDATLPGSMTLAVKTDICYQMADISGFKICNWNFQYIPTVPSHSLRNAPNLKRWFSISENTSNRKIDVTLMTSFSNLSTFRCIRISPDGKYLATSCGGIVCILDIIAALEVVTFGVNDQPEITSICFTADSQHVIIAAVKPIICLYNIHSGKTKREFTTKNLESFVTCLDISPAGDRFASGSSDLTAQIWDIESGQVLMSLICDHSIERLEFSPDGNLVTIGSSDNVILWDINKKCVSNKFLGYRYSSFSTPEFIITSNPGFQKMAVWQLLSSGAVLAKPTDQMFSLSSGLPRASPDGKWIACGAMGHIRFHNIISRELEFAIFAPARWNWYLTCTCS